MDVLSFSLKLPREVLRRLERTGELLVEDGERGVSLSLSLLFRVVRVFLVLLLIFRLTIPRQLYVGIHTMPSMMMIMYSEIRKEGEGDGE
jgi:hypothetical protein